MKKIISAAAAALLILQAGALFTEKSESSVKKLTGVEISEKSSAALRINMKTSGKVRFHVFRVADPPRLVVEMVDTLNRWDKEELDVDGSIVKRVRAGQYKTEPVSITRVVLDMDVNEYIHDEVSTRDEITILASLTEKELAKLEKEKPDEKVRLSLEPNIPGPEHKARLREIKEEQARREEEMARRESEIARVDRKLREMREKEVVPGSLVSELSREPVDFNFKEAEIKEVLRVFEQKLDRNIVPTDEVVGKVTLRLRNVPFDEALGLLLKRMDLAAVQTSANIIEIMPVGRVPVKRKSLHIRNRKAEEMKEAFESLLTESEQENATIAFDGASNNLIVSAPPDVLEKVELIARELDIKEPQIRIKARLIEVGSEDGIDTGVSWAAHSTFEESEDIERGRAVFSADDYSFTPTGEIDHRDTIRRFTSGVTMDVSAVLDDVDLYGLLNLLATKSRAKTLSEPSILTQNGKEAKIHVGQALPVRTVERTAEGLVESVEFIDEGVQLEVTPTVSPGSDQITLEVQVSVSELIGFRVDMPIIADRSAESLVTVPDGRTVVIGGLIRESERSEETGIPILKDIPLLGYFFKRRESGKDRNELLIFLTPELIKD